LSPITVWEGFGQGTSGCDLSLQEATLPKFYKYFELSGALWFLETISEMEEQGLFSEETVKILIERNNPNKPVHPTR